MMLGMFLFWVLVLGGSVWLLARLFPCFAGPPEPDAARQADSSDPAMQIVRRRYASGEITQAEYEELLRTLG
jgi:uncharacterized membrane protein